MNRERTQNGMTNRISASTWTTIAALIAMAAAELIGVLVMNGEHPPFALILELVLLGLAALMVIRRWWASAVVSVITGVLSVLGLDSVRTLLGEPPSADLTFAVVFLGLSFLATIAGFRATLENYRNRSGSR